MSRSLRPAAARLARLVVGLAAVLVLAGCGAGRTDVPAPVAAPADASASSSVPTPRAAATQHRGPAPLPGRAKVGVTSVTIASIGVRTTRLERLTTDDDGVLEAPKDPDRAGWYADGTVPGEIGPAVIAGHVDSTTGPAVFFDLREVGRGDRVVVGLSDHTSTTFVVDRVVTTPKKGFPTDEVFGPSPDAQLRLITCGGPYDRTVGSYEDNTVVFATAR